MESQSGPRLFLALGLSFLIFIVWTKYISPPPVKPAEVAQQQPAVPTTPQQSEKEPTETTAEKDASKIQLLDRATKSEAMVSSGKWKTFWNLTGGASISRTEFTEYKTSANPKKSSPQLTLGTQKKTFVLEFSHPDLKPFNTAPYAVAEETPQKLVLIQKTKAATVKRTFSVRQGTYAFNWIIEITPKEKKQIDWGVVLIKLDHVLAEQKTSSVDIDEVAASIAGKRLTQLYQISTDAEVLPDTSTLEKWKEMAGQKVDWISVGDHYFMQALAPEGRYNPNIDVKQVPARAAETVQVGLSYPLRTDGTSIVIQGAGYFGPRSMDQVEVIPALKSAIDLGMWRFIAEPILWFLNFIHNKVVANYGVAIIILTLAVRLLMLPVIQKQMQSMKRMQAVQPELNRIREKYKNDKARLNQEMMSFMRMHKVNPLAVCFPLLLQLPVFIALWQALSHTADLFHAPFFWWIHDLSAKDPYYVLPVLMAGLMFVQQLTMPKSPAMDKAQQRMMLFIPLIFSFFMLNLPSGLTLYMTVSSLFGIIQQFATRTRTGGVVATKGV